MCRTLYLCVHKVSYGDERFPPREQGPIVATPTTQLLRRAGDVAQVCDLTVLGCTLKHTLHLTLSQELLDHYVKVQGQVISQVRLYTLYICYTDLLKPGNLRIWPEVEGSGCALYM